MGKKIITFITTIFIFLTFVISILIYNYKDAIEYAVKNTNIMDIKPTVYYAKDFGFEDIKSNTDFDNDGIDDYTDILEGARIEAENKPEYKDGYYNGGYPPDTEGVCSDVIWRSFKNAGYLLKDMVDKDIKENYKFIFSPPYTFVSEKEKSFFTGLCIRTVRIGERM